MSKIKGDAMYPSLNDLDTDCIDDAVCEDDAISIENSENESSWDFIDKSVAVDSSDDDSSIVIIEREIHRQDSAPTSSAESENEETDIYRDVLIDPSSTSEKNMAEEPNAIAPLYTVLRLDNRPKRATKNKLHQNNQEVTVLFATGYLAIMSILIVYLHLLELNRYVLPPSPKYNRTDPLITELHKNMESSKSLIDDVYAFQRDLLMSIKRVNDELYVANLTHFKEFIKIKNKVPSSPLITKEWDSVLNALHEPIADQPECKEEFVCEHSPCICVIDHSLFLVMNGEQMKSVFDNRASFLRDVAQKYERFNDDMAHSVLLKPSKKQESTVFAQDCDNFSKNYRSDYCLQGDGGGLCNAENSKEKSCSDNDDDKDESRPSQESPKIKRATKDLLDLMVKFKNEFDYLYKMYAENEEMEADVQIEEEDEDDDDDDDVDSEDIEKNEIPINETDEAIPKTDTDAKLATAQNEGEERESKPVDVSSEPTKIGEWLFDMHAAREQLRHYYEHAISGDWVLRLGKQRERLRKTKSFKKEFYKKESNKRDDEQSSNRWKAPEKLRRGLKKMASKWKSKFKKMKDNFVHTYEKYVPSNWQLRWSF